MTANAEIVRIFLSPGHNFFGHHGKPPGDHPAISVSEASCVAGKGLEGDRFFDFKPGKFPEGYDGQVTFFAWETYEDVCRSLDVTTRDVSVFRRNVVTRGLDLNALAGRDFEIQGVQFRGMKEAAPCEWMNTAFAPGALTALKGRGGLRARVLTDGIIRVTSDSP